SITFIAVLLFFGLGFVFSEKSAFSEREKRKLTVFPAFSLQNIKNGTYMDSLDDFTADHFFQRNWFLGLADSLKSLKGIQKEGKKVYTNLQA
ncbi:MAG: DHHW family protein, partial [Thermoflexibacteraceae bacterium]